MLLIIESIAWKNAIEEDPDLEEEDLTKRVVRDPLGPDPGLSLGIEVPVEAEALVVEDHLEDPDIIQDQDQIQKTGSVTGQGDPRGNENT